MSLWSLEDVGKKRKKRRPSVCLADLVFFWMLLLSPTFDGGITHCGNILLPIHKNKWDKEILNIRQLFHKVHIVCEISTVDLSYVVTIKSTVEISQNFVAFSEYMNLNSFNLVLTFFDMFKFWTTLFSKNSFKNRS